MVDFSRFQLVPSAAPIDDAIESFSPQARQQREFQRRAQEQQLQLGGAQLAGLGQQQQQREFQMQQQESQAIREQVDRDTLKNIQDSRVTLQGFQRNIKDVLDGSPEGLVSRMDIAAGRAFEGEDPDFDFEEFAELRRSALEDPDLTISQLSGNLEAIEDNISFLDEQELIMTSTPLQRRGLGKAGAVKFVGTPNRVVREVDGKEQAFLTGIVQDPSAPGGFRREDVPIEGEFVSTLGETAEDERKRKLETERDLNQILADRAKNKKLSEGEAERLDTFISDGITAVGQLPNIKRGLKLLESVKTGGATARSKAVTDFFGTTSGDISELNNILAQNVLAGLAAFTGAISEGERQFIERMQTGLSQGTEFNIRELQRMERILDKQVSRAKRAAKASGDQFSIDEINRSIDPTGFAQGLDGATKEAPENQQVFEVNF